jgi:hypothetical protein
MLTQPSLAGIGAVSAIGGALVLAIGTALHPMAADPADLQAAFTEYARDPYWVASHLAQFSGAALIGVGLLAVTERLLAGSAAAWGWVGALGAVASVTLAAVLQAVDGVALKVMATRWLTAGAAAEGPAFEAAVAVRQIEVGLASLLSIVFGLTVLIYAAAMWTGRAGPRALAVLGLVSGAGTLAAGVVAAHDGFSELNMLLTSVAGPLSAVWTVLVGLWLWRTAPSSPTR